MDNDLQFLIHFYNDKEYLFKTITMAPSSRVEEICDQISSQKGWYWPRFAQSERHDYLTRRLFVEKQLYEDYTQEYGDLKERIPVYFYLIPKLTEQKATELGRQRTKQNEKEPGIMLVMIEDLEDTSNITFTLSDSHTAYRKKALEAGIRCRGDGTNQVLLPDHNRVFPFSMIDQMHQKYRAQDIYYEVQIWDYELLEKMSYTILGNKEA